MKKQKKEDDIEEKLEEAQNAYERLQSERIQGQRLSRHRLGDESATLNKLRIELETLQYDVK